MKMHVAQVVEHNEVADNYRVLIINAPELSTAVNPGQFIHMLVPRLEAAVLRRPFSVYKAGNGRVSILYKTVGHGTRLMRTISPGEKINLIGPLGNGFPICHKDKIPIFVAGGFGVAPLSLLASRMKRKGIIFIGGASSKDILCVGDFRKMGWDIRIATDDGSRGKKGLVTSILDEWMGKMMEPAENIEFYACGPDGMLKAVGERAIRIGCKGWLSLDKHMGCGVGACLACVQKIRHNGVISLVRVCREGPVFEAGDICWE